MMRQGVKGKTLSNVGVLNCKKGQCSYKQPYKGWDQENKERKSDAEATKLTEPIREDEIKETTAKMKNDKSQGQQTGSQENIIRFLWMSSSL